MRRSPWLAAIAGLFAGLAPMPDASAYIMNLGGTYVPGPGQVELISYRFYAPFNSRIEGGQLQPIADGYNFAEAWTAVEVGLGGGYSAMFVYPFDRIRPLAGGDERAGLAGFTFNLNRQLWAAGPYEGRLRFRTDVASTNDGSPRLNRFGLQHSQSMRLGGKWRVYANANYFRPLPRPGDAGATLLPGHQVELNTAIEYNVNQHLSVMVEQLSSWQTQATLDGVPNPASGAGLVQLAPGVTWVLTPQLALQASVALPVYWSGFQDAAPWTTAIGTVIDF
jgi:hypothetical protein